MKRFNIGILLLLFTRLTCSAISSDSLHFFSQATQQIVASSEYLNFVEVNPDKYTVSCIQFPYDQYMWGFQEEIEKFTPVELERTYNRSLFLDGYNENLKQLSSKRKSKNVILFSKIRKGIFFAQVIQFGKKKTSDVDIPMFGIELLFMFHISDAQKPSLISISEVHHN